MATQSEQKRDAATANLASPTAKHQKTSTKKGSSLTLLNQDHEYARFHNELAVALQAAYGDSVSAFDKQIIVRIFVCLHSFEYRLTTAGD